MEQNLTARYVAGLLPPRPLKSHKGDFGRVLIVAGSRGMTGASVLAASAAMRSGAGLVTLALPNSQQAVVASQLVEVLTYPLPETRQATLHLRAVREIQKLIDSRGCDVLVLGPGLSTHPQTQKAVLKILALIDIPTVLDADALNILATLAPPYRKKLFSKRHSPVIVTPHPGEMSRLLGVSISQVQKDREDRARYLAKELGVVCVLKGYRTVITDGTKTFLNSTGNPGLAKAGTGDVLAGMLGAFWPQVCISRRFDNQSALKASCLAVYVHGLCGDLAAKESTEQGLLARDLSRFLPRALRKLKSRR
ncbi:MAG: NAD(P)H-hydrate dehydratase [Elusimicrobia bacterium]|nr:NAD(P)H-hydrate dehydratase [Elusimicrobiota bacterium]